MAVASGVNAVIKSPITTERPMIIFFMGGSVAKIELKIKLEHDKI